MNDVISKIEQLEKSWVNLADSTLGAKILFVTDEFFAPAERMLNPEEPLWKEGVFDDNGKWMDGWETRRKRDEGHDYCIVQLAKPGAIKAIDLYTRYFTGNYAPVSSVDVCHSEKQPDDKTDWVEIMPSTPLQGDSHNFYEIKDERVWTHLRLNIFPDGGIARLRVYDINSDLPKDLTISVIQPSEETNDVKIDWRNIKPDELIELSAIENGGRALECSDEHFGETRNLLKPGRGINMGDGWETRRTRQPNHDWVIISFGHAGVVKNIEIDTAHFKGNFPHQVSINATYLPNDCNQNVAPRSLFWKEILPLQRLEMDKQHFFEKELLDVGPISHVRVNIHPDGGLSRIRFFGYIHIE